MATSPHEVTQLLLAWSDGDQEALAKLAPLVYAELRRIARAFLRQEGPGQTLQTTALVHEAYLRLIDVSQVRWENRAHFYGVCARLMREILVEFARSRRSLKHGGGARRVSLDEAWIVRRERDSDLVALDEALDGLTKVDPRKGRVVELRFFGGLSVAETAEVLQVSTETVKRDWRLAKLWLLRELDRES